MTKQPRTFDLLVRDYQEQRLKPGWSMSLRQVLMARYPLMSEERFQAYCDALVHCRIRAGVVEYAVAREGECEFWPRLRHMKHRTKVLKYRAQLRGEE